MENKLKQAVDILSVLLGIEIKENSYVSMQNCETWDSMKHIEIITTIEDELGVSFEIEDIPNLTSVALILDKIKKMGE